MNKELKKDLIKLFLIGGLIYFFYSVSSILLPFVLGIVIAFLSNNVTNFLEKKIKNRSISSLLVVSIITFVIVVLLAIVIPLAISQSVELITELIAYLNKNNEIIYLKIKEIMESFGIADTEELKTHVMNYSKSITSYAMMIINSLVTKSVALISLLSLVVITPITAYYFLTDWNKNISLVNSYIPTEKKKTIKCLFAEINDVLMACIKGQLIVCSILGLFYGMSLLFTGLKYGFLIGVLTGLASFIPYIGMFFGVALAMFVNFYQFGFDLKHITILVIIFVIGQILEGNFLTPKLVGDKIKLNPLWVIFALFSGGALFGLLGMLIALPLAAVIGVLVRFFIKEKLKKYENN